MNDERKNDPQKDEDPRGDLAAADKQSQDERPAGPSTRSPAPGRGTTLGPLPPGVKPEQPDAEETQHPRVAGSLRRDFAYDPEHDAKQSNIDPGQIGVPTGEGEVALQNLGGKPHVSPAGNLIGHNIVNQEGEELGSVEDIAFDTESGRIAYVVLASGGFLGMGEKLFAIPWAAIRYDESTDQFVLNVKRETLENAPGFDKSNWPDMADPEWATQVHDHYNYPPFWGWKSP